MAAETVTPVAVIGMACRLPGGIDSPQRLWEALLGGEDLVVEIPRDRWDVDQYYDPEPGVPGRSLSKWGAFLDDVAGFDSDFFNMTEREATSIDPQHRLLLETSWDAFEHAGLDPSTVAGSQTGVFVGHTHGDYELLVASTDAAEGPYGFAGTNPSMASGRVAYALGLHGPALTVDTACSSGLMALHQACRSLHQNESDLTVAAGVTVSLEPRKYIAGSLQGMLSPTGRCHAFDADADGFVSAEGCVVVLLKRLEDAQRDGDRILAVIRGTAANQDGSTINIATPSERAQVEVYRSALAAAGVDAASIGYVEAHGTGTPVGDPIEYAGLATVYGTDGPTVLGSVKSNFGHMQATSGPLGLMKAVLALQHGIVPQNLHFNKLPDKLAAIDTQLFVPQETTPWPHNGDRPRRAVVSSYGLSGTNVHAVLEQAPAVSSPREVPGTVADPTADAAAEAPAEQAPEAAKFFTLSATSPEQLRVSAGRLADWLAADGLTANAEIGGGPATLDDLGYTLARRRSHRPVRTAVGAGTIAELEAALREVSGSDVPMDVAAGKSDRGPVWVFSGQGSQWPRMGAHLLATEPVFAATIAKIEPIVAAESGFSITEAITAPQTVTGIDRVQPTLFSMQVALAEAMKAYGVVPGAVIGHSLGEAAASVVAGALTLEDGLRVICRRSKLMHRVAGAGAMASVELPAQQVLSELSIRGIDDVVIAVVASPTSTVVGGATQTIRDLVKAWEEKDVMAREVAVDVASHTPQVEPILDDLIDALADLKPRTPEVPYYSATLWDPNDKPAFDAQYWADNLRFTVRFGAAVQAALNDGHRVFAELSPHPLLNYAVSQNASSLDMTIAALAAMRREQELPGGLRGFLTDLYAAGAAVDFTTLYPGGRLVDSPLPTWTHRELMLSRDEGEQLTHGAAVRSVHPLLGSYVHLFEEPERHVWQGEVGTETHPWLADHQINGVATLPGAAYCEMALSAAARALGEGAAVRDIRFEQTLLLGDETSVSAAAAVTAPGLLDFAVETHDDGIRIRRAGAVLVGPEADAAPAAPTNTDPDAASDGEPQAAAATPETTAPVLDIEALLAAHPTSVDGNQLRAGYEGVGIHYGPAFCGLVAAHIAGPNTLPTGEAEETSETAAAEADSASVTDADTEAEAADPAPVTVLAEVALPPAIRSQQQSYLSHPALLDACFQSVIVLPEVQAAAAEAGLLLPVGVRELRCLASTRNAHYSLARVTTTRPGECEVDIDIADKAGTVLMTVRGLRLGGGGSGGDRASRVLNERLLTIEWESRDVPGSEDTEASSWLVLDTAAEPDGLSEALGEKLVAGGATQTVLSWPLGAELPTDGQALSSHFTGAEQGYTGVVVVTGAAAEDPLAAAPATDDSALRRGEEHVAHVAKIVRELAELPSGGPRLFVVTRGAATVLPGDVANLEHTGLRGLLRVTDTEYPHLSTTQIDVDLTAPADRAAANLAEQLLSGSDEDETAWRNDGWYTARLRPGPLRADERRTAVVEHGEGGLRMEIRTPGDLQTMEFVAAERVAPGPGEIEVAVTSSSINFADVLVTFGRYPSFEGHLPRLGTDFAGVVTAVGPDVTEHAVGDHVGGMSPNGCWGTFVTCNAKLTATIPEGLTDGQAAAVTTAHATAYYGLRTLARLSGRDKVLIHSGSGGVGQAAIAIARSVGAEVFATAGSEGRRQVLRDMGIEHVYDSRSTDFADEIRKDTNGYGVDVVLNSLTGPAQLAGFELLSFGGRFVEIGKLDIYGNTRLGLFPFRRNLTFYAVDLGLMSVTHPEEVHELLETVYRLTADGTLPVPQSTHYPIEDAAAAVRLVAGAGHTGKVVLDVARSGRSVAMVSPAQAKLFRHDGAYILTGGLGGLGMFLAEEMAAAGCGRIVLNSRSEPSEQAAHTIERLREAGADVVVERGDVSDPATAARLVAAARETGLTVRGVLHAAAVVEDATLANVTDELVGRCWQPKADGAWHLHQALASQEADEPLDWFCSFSSAAALVGSPGQSAYAAANSWLDAFAHWRRAHGLPGTSIAWGAWAEVGRATALAAALAETAGEAIEPADGFAAFRALISYDRPYSGYAPLTGTPWLTSFAQRSRFAEGFQASAKGQSDASKFRAELVALPREEWPSMVRKLVSDQLSLLLRRTIDADRPLSEYGLDSLGNLELRTRIESETGVRISPTEITTVRGLADHLCDQLDSMGIEPATA